MAAGAQATTGPSPFPGVLRGNRAWPALRRVGTVVLAVLLIRTFIGEASVVPTGSMERTILVGDHIFLNKALYGPQVPFTGWRLPALRPVRHGDIVAFRYPKDPELTFLKRVIALGGDRVEIRRDVVYLNGQPLTEPYVEHTRTKKPPYRENMRALVVPRGEMFVLGDNRDDSEDSRYFGPVPLDRVLGEPVCIYWSYNAPSAQWLDDAPAHRLGFYVSLLPHLLSRTRWSRVGELL